MHPTTHLSAHALFASHDVRNQKGTPLHATIVVVHGIPWTFPFFLTLLRVPLVRVITLVIGNSIEVMVSRRSDLVRIKVQPMRGGLSLALPPYTRYFTLHTRS